jgi:hypothetical protein
MVEKKKVEESIVGTALFAGIKMKVEEGKSQEALKEIYSLLDNPTIEETSVLAEALSVASTVISSLIEERLKNRGIEVEEVKFILFPSFVKADEEDLQEKVERYKKASKATEKLLALKEVLDVLFGEDDKEDK